VETSNPILECPNTDALLFRQKQLQAFLLDLERMHSALYIVTTMEYKLSLAFCLPYNPQYPLRVSISNDLKISMLRAICHYNIIGCDNFLKGYISKYWKDIKQHCTTASICQNWDARLIQSVLRLYQSLWFNRNTCLHGKSWKESKEKLRQRVINAVIKIYNHPPKLHSRFRKVLSVPLDRRLRATTTSLQQWLAKIEHQKKISESLFSHDSVTQMTLHQVWPGSSTPKTERDKCPP